MTITPPPVFSRVLPTEKNNYDLFMEYSNNVNLQGYAKGWNLDKLVNLATKAYAAIEKANPILREGEQCDVVAGRQWQINHLSQIKERVGLAIEQKRAYYDNSPLGVITKHVLKCLGMWNAGDTASIVKAEDFLIMYDSRRPLFKNAEGKYVPRFFFPLTPVSWVCNTLDTSRFYNYNPRRAL